MQSSALILKNLSKRYGENVALSPSSVSIPKGTFTSILGPSGCGKTTTLMLIAGIEKPSTGQVWLEGENITDLALQERGIGIVFQNYALFPNLSVRENILYGLQGKIPLAEQNTRLSELLALTHLEGLESRYPHELSGGQQQRVAIARALAPKPKLLLLDEPLSALDAWTRSSIGQELRDIQQKSGVTTIMVTHDRSEALSLSDFILVMNDGVIEQADTPQTIYDTPSTEFVATFVGGMNIVRMPQINAGKPTGIRWGDVTVVTPTEYELNQPYTFVGQLKDLAFMGDSVRVKILLNDFETLITADIARTQPVAAAFTPKGLYAVRLTPQVWRQWGSV